MGVPNIIRIIINVFLAGRSALIAENLVLRQQLAVLSRSAKRPRLRRRDGRQAAGGGVLTGLLPTIRICRATRHK